VEAILDAGSQIVSMSQEMALQLGIEWNPDVRIRMQSANGSLDRSLGLANNVKFRFKNLTIYLQVHVLEKAAYDVLLGRPFDCVTKSEIKNWVSGDQTITLTCPNTNLRVVIPTFDRGKPPPKAEPPLSSPKASREELEANKEPNFR
jgi:hypothetical protein